MDRYAAVEHGRSARQKFAAGPCGTPHDSERRCGHGLHGRQPTLDIKVMREELHHLVARREQPCEAARAGLVPASARQKRFTGRTAGRRLDGVSRAQSKQQLMRGARSNEGRGHHSASTRLACVFLNDPHFKRGNKVSPAASQSASVMRESDNERMDSARSDAHCFPARSSRTSKLSH